jgi:hypothetical protein
MFANTLTLTIDGVAKTLTRINQDNFGSSYKFKDGTEQINLQFRNSTEKSGSVSIDRHNMFVERTIYATPTAQEQYYTASATLRVKSTNDPVLLDKLTAGFITLLTAQKAGLIGGES